MIKVNFNTYKNYVTDSLYQWDLNRELIITGLNLTLAPEIHFSNSNMDKAIVRQSTLEDTVVKVTIPNSLLQEALTIKAYVGVYEGEAFKTIEVVEIPVIAKEKPFDYSCTDGEEIYSFKALENQLQNVVSVAEAILNDAEILANETKEYVDQILNGTKCIEKAEKDSNGNVIHETYATKTELTNNREELDAEILAIKENKLGKEENAVSATKAMQDGNGNVITNTYATKITTDDHEERLALLETIIDTGASTDIVTGVITSGADAIVTNGVAILNLTTGVIILRMDKIKFDSGVVKTDTFSIATVSPIFIPSNMTDVRLYDTTYTGVPISIDGLTAVLCEDGVIRMFIHKEDINFTDVEIILQKNN